MTITNWLSAGRQGVRHDILINIHAVKKGSIGESKWDDYVQFRLYSKDLGKFIRLTMTKDEALLFRNKLNDKLLIFNR